MRCHWLIVRCMYIHLLLYILYIWDWKTTCMHLVLFLVCLDRGKIRKLKRRKKKQNKWTIILTGHILLFLDHELWFLPWTCICWEHEERAHFTFLALHAKMFSVCHHAILFEFLKCTKGKVKWHHRTYSEITIFLSLINMSVGANVYLSSLLYIFL